MKRIVFVGMALIAAFVSVAAQSLNTTTTNRVLFESADRTDLGYHYSGLAVPHRDSLTTNYTLRMPDTSNVGVQQMLVTNGSGQLRLIAPTNVGNYLLTRADGSLAWGYPWADTTLEWTWYGNAVSQAYAGDGSATAGARLGTLNNQALQVVVGNLNAMRLSGSQVLLGRGTSSGHFSLASTGSAGGTFAIATTQTDHIASTGTGALRIGSTVAGVASGTLGGTTALTIGTTGTSVWYQVAGLNGVTNALYSVGSNLQVASTPVNGAVVNGNTGLFLASSGGGGQSFGNNRILYIASSGSAGTGGGSGSGGKRFVALATRGATHPAYSSVFIAAPSLSLGNDANGTNRPNLLAYVQHGGGILSSSHLVIGGRGHSWYSRSTSSTLVLGGRASSLNGTWTQSGCVHLAPNSYTQSSDGFREDISIVASASNAGSNVGIATTGGVITGLAIASNGIGAGAGVLIGGNAASSTANNLVFNANPSGTSGGTGLSLAVRRTQLMSSSEKSTSVVFYEGATNGTDRVRLFAHDLASTQTYTLPSSAPAAANRPLVATMGGTMQWAGANVLTRSAGRIATGGNQVVVINDASVQAANQILVTYEDPAGAAGIDGRVTARAANVSFTVTLSAVPPADSFINYVILP